MGSNAIRAASFNASTIPSILLDFGARVIDANDAYLEVTRRSRDELIGMFSVDFLHADDFPGVLDVLGQLDSGVRSVRHRRLHRRGDGTWIDVLTVSSRIVASDGERMMLVQFLDHDPTAVTVDSDVEATQRLQIQPVGDWVCFHDEDGRIGFTTEGFADVLGRSVDWLNGRRLTDPALSAIGPDELVIDSGHDPVVTALTEHRDITSVLGLRSTDGTRLWFSVRSGPIGWGSLPARSTLRDITDLMNTVLESRRVADHDDLTGLKSRRAVIDRIDELVAADRPAAVVFIDLDDFKSINDGFGHRAGDRMLAAVAHRLERLAPGNVLVGRAGGDEFIAVTANASDAATFVKAVVLASSGPGGLVPDSPHVVRASVGLAVSLPDESSADLLARADSAMYSSKSSRAQTPLDRRRLRSARGEAEAEVADGSGEDVGLDVGLGERLQVAHSGGHQRQQRLQRRPGEVVANAQVGAEAE